MFEVHGRVVTCTSGEFVLELTIVAVALEIVVVVSVFVVSSLVDV